MSNFFLFMLSFVWRLSWNFPIAQMASVISLLKRFFQILIYLNEWEAFCFTQCKIFVWCFCLSESSKGILPTAALSDLRSFSTPTYLLCPQNIMLFKHSQFFLLLPLPHSFFGAFLVFILFVLWFILSFLSQFSSL